MKRIVLIIALLLAATTSFAQKRVILHKGDFNDEIYAIKNDDGEIYTFYQLNLISGYDSLYVMAGRDDLPALRQYLIELKETFQRWKRSAKANHVTDFQKPFGIESPVIVLRWAQRRKDAYSYVLRYDDKYSEPGRWLAPDFIVSPRGDALISLDTRTFDTDGNQYNIRLFIDTGDIDKILRWTDYDEISRTYERKKPKLTNEQVKALFD